MALVPWVTKVEYSVAFHCKIPSLTDDLQIVVVELGTSTIFLHAMMHSFQTIRLSSAIFFSLSLFHNTA